MKYLVGLSVLFVLLLPYNTFGACGDDGFSVVYVNGIFTNNSDAQNDTRSLKYEFSKRSTLSNVQFITGHNESHLAGADDLITSAEQVLTAVEDHDFVHILRQIHPQLTTRKVLLLGHSQGTFYTNELYKYLTEHGVPKGSIAVYNIATPASFVAGSGVHLTSQNDKVINGARAVTAKSGAKQPLPANIDIPLSPEEAASLTGGHSLSGVYLAGAPERIVAEVAQGLGHLTAPDAPDTTSTDCFVPPDENLSYRTQDIFYAVADPLANGVKTAAGDVIATGQVVADATVAVANAAQKAALAAASAAKQVASDLASNISAIAYIGGNAFSSMQGFFTGIVSQNIQVGGLNSSSPEMPQDQVALAESAPISETQSTDVPQAPRAFVEQQQLAELAALRDALQRRVNEQSLLVQQKSNNSAPVATALSDENNENSAGDAGSSASGGSVQLTTGGGGSVPTGGVIVISPPAGGVSAAPSPAVGSSDSSSDSNSSSTASSTPPTPPTPPTPTYPTINNFRVAYDLSLQFVFSWDPSTDINGETSTNTYALYDVTNPSSTITLLASSSVLSYSYPVNEIGRIYTFEFRVTDASSTVQSTTTVIAAPSFLDHAYFYRDPRPATSNRYLLDLTTSSSRPFWDFSNPDAGQNWRIIVTYLNRDAPKQTILSTAQQLNPDDPSYLYVRYRSCAGFGESFYSVLLFPYTSAGCFYGGLGSGAYTPNDLQNRRLFVKTEATVDALALTPTDFVTFAFYDLDHGGSGVQAFRLAAVDAARYHFQTSTPASAAPTVPTDLATIFDPFYSIITVLWHGSTDLDTKNNSLTYQINYSTSSALSDTGWQLVGTPLATSTGVTFPNAYTIGVRAMDDFGNVSAIATTTWSFPVDYVPLPSQGGHDSAIATIQGSPMGQQVFIATTSTIDAVALWMQNGGGWYCCSQAYLEIRDDASGTIGNAVLATSNPAGIGNDFTPQEVLYVFPSPVELSANTYYWFVVRRGPAGNANDSVIYGTAYDSYPDGVWSVAPSVDAYFRLRGT